MDTITIKKKNEVFMHVDCEPSIERELSEHFCFFVPGYKFMPAYKNRMWDGKIRLFDSRKKTMYCGLYKYLSEDDKKINLKNALNFSRKYFGEQESFGKINENVFSEFIQWLNLNKIEKIDFDTNDFYLKLDF